MLRKLKGGSGENLPQARATLFFLNIHLYSSKEKEKIHPLQDKLVIVQNVQPESPISPAQKNILIINRSISLQTRNADRDNYKINLPNSQFSISFIESRPSELELSLNPSEQDQRFRSESKRETQQSQNRHGFSC